MLRCALMLLLSLLIHWQLLAEAPRPSQQANTGGLKAPAGLTLVTISAAAANPEPKPEKKIEPKPEKNVVPKPKPKPKPKKVIPQTSEQPPPKKVEQPVEEMAASAQSTPKPSQQPGVASQPTLISEPLFRQPPKPPRYPKQARRRNQQGTAEVMAWLDRSGDVVRTELVRSSGFTALDNAALHAVSGWLFQPLQEDGIAQPARVQVPVRFYLH